MKNVSSARAPDNGGIRPNLISEVSPFSRRLGEELCFAIRVGFHQPPTLCEAGFANFFPVVACKNKDCIYCIIICGVCQLTFALFFRFFLEIPTMWGKCLNSALFSDWPLGFSPSEVKMRRCELDEENAALLQGVYLCVNEQNKTQVQRSITTHIRVFTACIPS